ncbi:MAG: hypothetical protein ACO25F_12075 [Erythrobacter sp.]
MKKLLLGAIMLALAACSSGPRQSVPDRIINRALAGAPGQAQPGDVVATEIAFARLAREKGQWTAFAEYAADDGLMFVPQPVNARQWLKGRANPAEAVRWQPHEVWMSCDGSLAVTRGAWQRPDGSVGYFTTVWERQRDRSYKWVLDQGDALAEPLAEPEFIRSEVADCRSKDAIAAGANTTGDALPARGGGTSQDGSLAYAWDVAADLSRRLSVSMIKGGKLVEVLKLEVAPPPQPAS